MARKNTVTELAGNAHALVRRHAFLQSALGLFSFFEGFELLPDAFHALKDYTALAVSWKDFQRVLKRKDLLER